MNRKTIIKIATAMAAGIASIGVPVSSAADNQEETIEIQTIVSEAKRLASELQHNIHGWKSGVEEKTTYMGVVIESVPDVLRDYIDLPKGVGLLLTRISKDGPAMKAGLKDNDILVSFDDQIVINFSQLSTLIDMKGPGASVPIKVLRKGEEMEFTILLEERMRKGSQFIIPNIPDVPDVPGAPDVDPTGLILDKFEEWIPGSVQVYIDENAEVHVDLQDLKNNLQDFRVKLLEFREVGDAPEIIRESGEFGARTTVVHAGDRSIDYTSSDGHLVLSSSDEGEQVIAVDSNGDLIYQGKLPENYHDILPEKAVRMIDTLKDSEHMLEENPDETQEIFLTNEAIEPVTVVLK